MLRPAFVSSTASCRFGARRVRGDSARTPGHPRPAPAPARYPLSPPAPDVSHRERPAQSVPGAAAAMVGAPESLLVSLRPDELSEAQVIGVYEFLPLYGIHGGIAINGQFIPEAQNGCGLGRCSHVSQAIAVQETKKSEW